MRRLPGSFDLADSLIWAGRYQDALEQAQRAVELRPDFGPAQDALAHAYLRLNRLDDAHRHYLLAGDRITAALVRIRQGDSQPARALLEELLGYKPRSLSLMYLAIDERYEPLRMEPRFQALVDRLGLPRRR